MYFIIIFTFVTWFVLVDSFGMWTWFFHYSSFYAMNIVRKGALDLEWAWDFLPIAWIHFQLPGILAWLKYGILGLTCSFFSSMFIFRCYTIVITMKKSYSFACIIEVSNLRFWIIGGHWKIWAFTCLLLGKQGSKVIVNFVLGIFPFM